MNYVPKAVFDAQIEIHVFVRGSSQPTSLCAHTRRLFCLLTLGVVHEILTTSGAKRLAVQTMPTSARRLAD